MAIIKANLSSQHRYEYNKKVTDIISLHLVSKKGKKNALPTVPIFPTCNLKHTYFFFGPSKLGWNFSGCLCKPYAYIAKRVLNDLHNNVHNAAKKFCKPYDYILLKNY